MWFIWVYNYLFAQSYGITTNLENLTEEECDLPFMIFPVESFLVGGRLCAFFLPINFKNIKITTKSLKCSNVFICPKTIHLPSDSYQEFDILIVNHSTHNNSLEITTEKL